MAEELDDYCKIFVDLVSTTAVTNLLSELADEPFAGRTIELSIMIIDVLENPDAGLTDDFVTWPVLIEIEKPPDAAWEDYIAGIDRVLVHLWGNGAQAVTACDFEHKLPWSGGIRRVVN
ncbi:hypothetical protein ABZY93_21035 [Streptomyces smyrnaeus]|uniref:hypothetical protein n=1 Tax=Streptomyces smyrnaeus TaxID=1387713 RepID=UPI0033AD1456